MSVFWCEKRNRWKYDFRRDGRRFAGYCLDEAGKPVASRRAAEDAEGRVKAGIGQEKPVEAPARASGGYTFAEAVEDWAENVAKHNRSWVNIRRSLVELLDFFGEATPCEEITEDRIDAYIRWAREQPVKRYVGGPRKPAEARAGKPKPLFRAMGRNRTDASINRYLNALRALLRRAHKRRRTKALTTVLRLKEPEAAPNPIRRQDLERLLEAAPIHVRRALLLCTHTGMRIRECLRLTWPQVDLEGRAITLGKDTKGKKGRVIPLNEIALAALEQIAGEERHASGRVILYRHKGKGRPRPVASIKRAWGNSLEKCGLVGRYRFHDSRAAFCSYLAELGIDAIHIKELAGHASITTTLRYVRPAEARLRHAVDLLGKSAPG